jgi:hypothetical protein
LQDFTHGRQPAALDPADILDYKSTGNLKDDPLQTMITGINSV